MYLFGVKWNNIKVSLLNMVEILHETKHFVL